MAGRPAAPASGCTALAAGGEQRPARGCWGRGFASPTTGPQGAETKLGHQPGNELKTI